MLFSTPATPFFLDDMIYLQSHLLVFFSSSIFILYITDLTFELKTHTLPEFELNRKKTKNKLNLSWYFLSSLVLYRRRLDSNDISQLDPLVFTGLPSLRQLRLDVNRLSSVPHEALSRVTTLEVL